MRSTHIVLVTIVLLAAWLRFYQLGENPPSLDWDEASIGYNAYSLMWTGKDEYGNRWPISVRSFNDYKPPLYTYVTIPSIALFGLTEFAVRLPSALAGTLTVLMTYFLVRELVPRLKLSVFSYQLSVGEIAALLLAISPWHLQFSRVAFEANLALFFFVLGIYLMMRASASVSRSFYAGGAVAFVATMYAYHSARVVVPLFALAVAITFRKKLRRQVKALAPAFLTALILLLPMLVTVVRGVAQARFTTVSVFTNPGIYTREEERLTRQDAYRRDDQGSPASLFHKRWIVLAKIVAENYLDHFNLEFLFLRGDGIGRHSAVGMGLLYLWELPFLLIGAYALVRNKEASTHVLFPWLMAAPAASALTTQTPHAVRSLLMLPTLQIITAYGILHSIKALQQRWFVWVGMSVLFVGSVLYYLNLYYVHTPIERSHDWQYGYRELVGKLTSLEEGVQEIIVTTKYDQPYIYVLFYKRVDPVWYQRVAEGGSSHFGKYFFRKISYERDKEVKEAIIVGAPEEIPDEAQIFDTIQFLDGREAFRLVRT